MMATGSFPSMTRSIPFNAFPVTYEFVNRFRTGEMPVGFADYTQYTYLSVFATEIRGLWDFSEVPGLYREDGTYSNVDTCSFKGISILRGAEYHKDDVWTYIKWLTDEPTQTAYGNELEAIIGTGNRYETANKYSLRNLDDFRGKCHLQPDGKTARDAAMPRQLYRHKIYGLCIQQRL